MPTYSDAPLPVGLDSLVGMGMSRVKLAIAVALAEHGGSLSTPDLVAALDRTVAGTTLARNLNELEDHGYITGDLPRDDRRRHRTRWSLNHAKLHADLRTLIQATTPRADAAAQLLDHVTKQPAPTAPPASKNSWQGSDGIVRRHPADPA